MTRVRWKAGLFLAVTAVLALAPTILSEFAMATAVLVCVYASLSLGFRLLLLTGLMNIAHLGFFAVGAYASGVLLVRANVPFGVAVVGAALAGGLVAAVIARPMLSVRAEYFFLVSFALYIVMIQIIHVWVSVTGGDLGLGGIPPIPWADTAARQYYVFVLLLVLFSAASALLDASRFGRELRAIGASERLSEAIGIDTRWQTGKALVIGGASAGLVGAAYGSYTQYLSPTTFNFGLVVTVLLATILGGTQYWWGPILGAATIVILPEVIHVSATFSTLIIATLVLAVMMLAPDGIAVAIVRWVARLQRAPAAAVPGAAPPYEPAVPDAKGLTAPTAVRSGVAADLLVVNDITVQFGGLVALDRVSFAIPRGQIVGIIGPNGAGKSTLFNVITGFVAANSGTCTLNGTDITNFAAHRIARLGLARSFQHPEIFADLSLLENLALVVPRSTPGKRWRRSPGPTSPAGLEALLELARLAAWRHQPAGLLSPAHRKILGVAMALATNPLMLCLDEPTAGLRDDEVADIRRLVARVSETGVTVMVVEHRVPFVTEFCERIIVLDRGSVLADADAHAVLADTAVRQAYLGEDTRVQT